MKNEKEFVEDKECYTDKYGCFHDGPIGYNPLGRWCGECTRESGEKCPAYKLKDGEYA